MGEPGPCEYALRNFGEAYVPEGKVRYPLRDPNKRRAFEALCYSEERGNRKALRSTIVESLPFYPARFSHEDQWGVTYDVDLLLAGPEGKTAPVRAKWIFGVAEDVPRLVTLYVKTTEWTRREREERS